MLNSPKQMPSFVNDMCNVTVMIMLKMGHKVFLTT